MQFKKIVVTEDIEASLDIRVDEVVPGHRYQIRNRHTDGFEDINFVKFMTYKEMIDNNMPKAVVEDIVPVDERDCESCKYYIVSEGVFTQDVIHALVQRMLWQYNWLPNGFYQEGIAALNKAKYQYELFTTFRKRYGFYHIPFSIKNFIEKVNQKTEVELSLDKDLIDTFFEFRVTGFVWRNKQELIDKLNTMT